jgi:predicted small secreted protein
MDSKLKKVKLFLKKYWLYFAIGICAIIAVIFMFPTMNSDNFWFKLVKKLMKQADEVNGKIIDINDKAREEEDKIRQDLSKDKNEIEEKARLEAEANAKRQVEEAQRLAQAGKENPDVATDQLSDKFGIPRGDK